MNSTNKEKETSVRDRLNEAIRSVSSTSTITAPSTWVAVEIIELKKVLIAARDRIDELEQRVEDLEMGWDDDA